MKPRTLKVTRKVTEETNCRSSAHPIGSKFLVGSKGDRIEVGFRTVVDNR
jgi:hypothetical protein